MEAISIRPCRPEDCPAVLELWHRAGATPSITDTLRDVARVLSEPAAALLVAVYDDRIVGSVIGGWDGWRGNIYRLAVLPELRRRGIAKALVQAVETLLAKRGAVRISVLIEHEHPWAAGFWDSLSDIGYRRDPRMARYIKTVSPQPR